MFNSRFGVSRRVRFIIRVRFGVSVSIRIIKRLRILVLWLVV